MKQLIFCVALAISNLILFAQKASTPTYFIIQGKFENYPEKFFLLRTFDDDNRPSQDSIHVNTDGSFYYKSTKEIKPQKAAIAGTRLFYSDVFVAPGYDLTLTCNVKEYNNGAFSQHKKIMGNGSKSSTFLFKKDSIISSEKFVKEWFEMNEQELLAFAKKRRQLNDSLYHVVFDRVPANDRYFSYFSEIISIDNTFDNFTYITIHATDDSTFSAAKMRSFVSENIDKKTLNNLYNEKYLASLPYRTAMTYYPQYLRKLECKESPANCEGKNFNVQILDQIAKHYKGTVKQWALYKSLDSYVSYCRSFAELNTYKKEFPQFVSMLEKKDDQQKIDTLFANMEKTLLRTQVGNAAPAFIAEDSSGRQYSIASYKGKVVYLDLWASWCGPCRQQTPYLKKLAGKFNGDSSIAFISVAVLDKRDKWKEALAEDTPHWLQLFDSNGTVQQAYVAYSIPKFILINKEGKIISFDAPQPSSGEEIEKLLRAEMAK